MNLEAGNLEAGNLGAWNRKLDDIQWIYSSYKLGRAKSKNQIGAVHMTSAAECLGSGFLSHLWADFGLV